MSNAGFGVPTVAGEDVRMCVYTNGAAVAALTVPTGTTCGDRPCWIARSGTYQFRDRGAQHSGIEKLQLRRNGAAVRLDLKARGVNVPTILPIGDFAEVVVQLASASATDCWESRFQVPPGTNDPDRFSARLRAE